MTTHHRPPQKDQNESHYTGAERASELHDLSSCHQRANEKGVHKSVGEIPKVES